MEQPSTLVCFVFSRIQAAKPVNKSKNLLDGGYDHPADLHFFFDGRQLRQDGLPRYTSHTHPKHEYAHGHPNGTADPYAIAHQHAYNGTVTHHKIITHQLSGALSTRTHPIAVQSA
jgi:hypothetical protein